MTRPWQSVTEAFHFTVDAHADRPALHTADGTIWTYAQTQEAVAHLAGAMQPYLLTPEPVIVLALPRSADWIFGVLAAWRVGAAVSPLDPTLAVDRIKFILSDATPSLVLTLPEYADLFAAAGIPVVTQRGNVSVPPFPLRPDMLAYRIYTSGSTGQPKGVEVEHRGLTTLLRSQISAFELGPGDRVLWFLCPFFDASLSDIGTTLLAGATIYIEPESALRDFERLVRLLHEHQITHWDIPPTLLGVLDPCVMPKSLRTLIVGGEASAPEVIRRWARRFRLVNVYGPTEATICSSLCVCDPDRWDEPLLGQPTPGMGYLVLDPNLEPMQRGAVGELAIVGSGVARGYFRRPELTASKFILLHGERLYRTGDLVHWRDDGEYVFRGRIDRQVKILGQLVAPEEVEASLKDLPGIQTAVVLKRRLESAGRDGLIAFYTAEEPAPTPAELRTHLETRQPRWMIPLRFERLAVLPQMPTGKPDLAALATLPLPEDDPKATDIETRTMSGRILGELLRSFLGIRRIDWEASYWDHGGDSLTLLRLAQATHARGLRLTPARLAQVLRLADLLADCDTGANAHAMRADDLRRDAAKILAELHVSEKVPRPPSQQPTCVLLTGATGFLGAYLLGDLLRHPFARIICLVRARSSEEGRARLVATQPTDRRLLVQSAANRMEVLCGDLTAPGLGLGQAAWRTLANQVDLILHSGAGVHLLHDYPTLRAVNVTGTGEIIRLAAERARLHYVSTLSVFVGSDQPTGRFMESDDLRSTESLFGGYAQSKWAAESLVRLAQAQLAQSAIYRLGLVTGDSQNGFTPGHDFLSLFITGLAQLRCLPEIDVDQLGFDVTPVDYASAALVYLAMRTPHDTVSRTFHLAGRRAASLREILGALQELGIAIETLDWPTWRCRLAKMANNSHETAATCLALARAMPNAEEAADHRCLDLFPARAAEFDQTEAQKALADSGIVCPPPSHELLKRYVSFVLKMKP